MVNIWFTYGSYMVNNGFPKMGVPPTWMVHFKEHIIKMDDQYGNRGSVGFESEKNWDKTIPKIWKLRLGLI